LFGRDIFVLIDGTGCHLGTGTNVQRLKVLSEGAGYHARYSAGVGVISRTRIRDRIFAPNLEPEAFAIFDRLIDMDLTTQDRLYIIGYSRGAIIARILAMAIASPNALKAIVGSAEVPKSISAKIQFLGLFDPVVGWPRFTWRKVADHEAIFEEKIGYYMEIIALNERRVSFKSDNTLASPKVSKRARSISSKTNVQTKKDRAELRKFLQLRKTRRSVLFPGTHSDIGGQGGDPQTSLHSLLTMLEEL
jgi:uncharacterized protein (DUF2235 family)